MLESITIRNYALINNLSIEFKPGLTIITGETGAGKSILIGALSLILGQRADTSVLLDKNSKCIVEGVFNITNYDLYDFFHKYDLDFDNITHLRREITANGKSRAFINDTPVNLNQLREIAIQLIDIHSQHQNLELGKFRYQLSIIDIFASHSELLKEYRKNYFLLNELTEKYEELQKRAEKEKSDFDYFLFQFNQLEEARLNETEQKDLEDELEILTHAEEIKNCFTMANNLISENDSRNILDFLKQVHNFLVQSGKFLPQSTVLSERLNTAYVEIKDISREIELVAGKIEYDSSRIEKITKRLDLLYTLEQKHRVATVGELIQIHKELSEKIHSIANYETELEQLKQNHERQKKLVTEFASRLSKNRRKIIPALEKKVVELLIQLGIPNARFSILLDTFAHPGPEGFDTVNFLFSANKNIEMQEISKVASGGEISRLMMSIKSLVSQSLSLPTILFDEIDSGVSGNIAHKMGNIMRNMAKAHQIITITHLPQIAGKGQQHYYVHKLENKTGTSVHILQLTPDERIKEIARLLSGEQLTEAALENAKELLKN